MKFVDVPKITRKNKLSLTKVKSISQKNGPLYSFNIEENKNVMDLMIYIAKSLLTI